jgi:hypothetical protein
MIYLVASFIARTWTFPSPSTTAAVAAADVHIVVGYAGRTIQSVSQHSKVTKVDE